MNDKIYEVRLEYKKRFGHEAHKVFSCGGRFEILGNHTDHNHGLCLAATCDLEITAAVSKRDDNMISFISKGYPEFDLSLDELEIKEEEKNTSIGLVRGIAAYLKENGYKIGGLNVYTVSTIFAGAGVSSSAAFELLVGELFNYFYNNNKIDRLVLCKAGQYSENNYFGKKSGLLDQIGVGYGNIVSIDFEDIAKPKIDRVFFPFKDLHFVIVNTGGSHAELSDLYSSIPFDMYSVAKKLGHEFLRECTRDEVESKKSSLSILEYRRAIHFFDENERVKQSVKAIKSLDKEAFLDAINESRLSSANNLRNMMVENAYEGSPLEACNIAMKIIGSGGACKINGGGFAGSIICVVPDSALNDFITKMSEKYGEHNVKEVKVRKRGPSVEDE